MILLEDTRNKPGKHDLKAKWFSEHGIKVERTKLYVGDYTLPANQSVCVDSKQSIGELVSDVIQDHERFRAELIRAQEAGIKLFILVENKDGVETLEDIKGWKNPRRFTSPKCTTGGQLYKILNTMWHKYGALFLFCKPEDSARVITSILLTGGNLKNDS